MVRTIQIIIEKQPTTCFDCDFASKSYITATCPFLNTKKDDGEPCPKECPLKIKNKNKFYKFNP